MLIHRKSDTSRPEKGYKNYPYLLGGLRGGRTNQAGCADITFLPIRKGFFSQVAVMDWFTREGAGLAHLQPAGGRLLRRGAERGDSPLRPTRIMNIDQGNQFTSIVWADRLKRVGTRISMDGKGRCLDFIFIERLWRHRNRNASIYTPGKLDRGPRLASGAGSPSTTTSALTPPTEDNRPPGYSKTIETDQQIQAVA